MDSKPLVLVIEDEDVIQNFIGTVLNANGYRVVRAATGHEGLSLMLSHIPDIILLDLGLPDLDGVEVLQSIRKQTHVPVIIVSARGHEQEKVDALDHGADDYVVKPFGTSELMARIRTALRHGIVSSDDSASVNGKLTFGMLEIDLFRRHVILNGESVHLTPIEYKILSLLAQNSGRVLTHDAIVREVWGGVTDESHALRVNMANIRRKIEINPGVPQYILTEVGVGYRMAESVEPHRVTS
jgi:two-component system, OmpR family, KDP operon response regulator KdpE